MTAGIPLQAPAYILQVWRQFDGIPTESFTKGWWYRRCGGAARQRTVAEMALHRRTYGAGGNCFDLALWLRHEFQSAGIPARVVGHDLCTPDAHVALVAGGPGGEEYLCDLGDLWLQPIRLETCGDWYEGFVPGRAVQLKRTGDDLLVLYRRANGKVGEQHYDLRVITEDEWQEACHHSQNLLRRPFCEVLRPHPETGRVEHWEYDNRTSFWNLADGPVFEEACVNLAAWAARISQQTGMAPALITAGFAAYGIHESKSIPVSNGVDTLISG